MRSSTTDETKLINEENNDDEIEATQEELAELEHISDRIPHSAWLIVICEFCERFAFIGLSGPFQNYIQFPDPGPHGHQPGALGRGHRMATLLTTCFQFLCYFTPIGGAILADQYWGKYKTIVIGCIIYVFGLLVLVLTSIPYSIKNGFAFPGLIASMIILGCATGGLKSNVSPLMAQQYTRTKPIIKIIKGKKKVIDPKLTIQSMFTWFYLMINVGGLSVIISTNIEKYFSFWLAYLVPMTVFTGCIIVLAVGRRQYIDNRPNGSLIIRACKVTATAFRLRWKIGKKDDCHHILDYAREALLPINCNGGDSATNLDQNMFIEHLKQAWRACRVFAFYPFYWLCCVQLSGNSVSQAAQMNVGPLPNDILQNTDAILILFLVPLFEKLIYPTLRRFNIRFTSIQRITLGFIFASFAIAWTTYVQHRIYVTGPNYDFTTKPCATCQSYNNISIAWQIPSYVLMALAEIFGSITGLEYAFTHAPASMKSIIVSLFLFTTGIGSALNFALLPVLVDPKLVWMYGSLSIMAFTVGVLFYWLFQNEEKTFKKESINQQHTLSH